jgi:hypothetical protein
MHKPKIFLVGDDKDNLITLEETSYLEELVLQNYLVDYPDLLPGDQIDPETPRRWLLVAQEMGVPGEEYGGGRWSLDHLFLDQDGVPTFVECKRATDTRARREVVAQMLDYAANGTEYWSMDRLRQAAAETAQKGGYALDEGIAELLEGDEDVEAYWDSVEANLRDHRVRLVFVADSTPQELRRMVEFLNEEMRNVEVLAVEIKQFRRGTGRGQAALVPRVVGLTEAARRKSSSPSRRYRTSQEFLDECAPNGRKFFQRVLDLARERGHEIGWGTTSFSVRADFSPDHQSVPFARGYSGTHRTTGDDEFHFCFQTLEPVLSQVELASWRQDLLAFDVLREAGTWTLKAPVVTEDDLARVNRMYDFVLDRVDEFAATREREEEPE